MSIWSSRGNVPGRKLSHAEQQLLQFWQNPPTQFDKPLLRQLRVQGGPGLRGIRSLIVPFPYPVTAICGRNGVGKSTVLALAALSARSPAAWRVYWGNTRPRTRPDVRAQYEFADFFHRRAGDVSLDGLRISWIYMERGNEIEFVRERSLGRWRRVTDVGRHPEASSPPYREIDFIPVSRVLPASDYGAMRSAFAQSLTPIREALNEASISRLSYVLGRTYETAETRFIRGLGLAACTSGTSYSGFDMGGGEAGLISLLLRLQAMPRGGLVVIEEIELGLHAEAQARLVEILLDVCREQRLQIICTTHSEVVLDNLPRLARVLLRRSGAEHEAVGNISTRFAIHEMSGVAQPELMVYTEDRFAALLVGQAIPGTQRARIEIRDIGSNATLARQAVAHMRLHGNLRALSAFDGDCTNAMIERWVREERADRHDLAPEFVILPGDGLPPERWLLAELEGAQYLTELARELDCDVACAMSHLEAMRVQLDSHGAGYTLARRTGLNQADAERALVRSVARRHPALDDLRIRILGLLGP